MGIDSAGDVALSIGVLTGGRVLQLKATIHNHPVFLTEKGRKRRAINQRGVWRRHCASSKKLMVPVMGAGLP
jgi:hypothetical protein